jgi:hypothetical protein
MKLAALAAAVFLASAPFQCTRESPVSEARDETPGEALLQLADELHAAGDRAAEVRTLRFLVERYGLARQAEEARVRLRALGEPVPAPLVVQASASAALSP